ncbi:MAG: PAS domain S-box protein, partial [Alphaproteobacteria bacterium]|nr:PAS domain S-box protein [Alphaproteobacteria bacterium]
MAGHGSRPWIAQVSRSLSFKQARVAVIVALILGMGFSLLQIAVDLRNERQRIDIAFEQALKAFEESAFRAAYGLDEVLAQTVVRGLFQQTAIFEAEIVDNFGDRMAIVNRPQQQGALKWLADGIFGEAKTYAIPLHVKETESNVGNLSIRVDTYIIAETFLRRSGLILFFGILRNLILAIILAVLFHRMLTKPLREVGALIREDRTLVQIPPNHEDDELGDLIKSHNDLSQQRSEAETALRESEERFRDMAESASDWFWEMGPDLRFTYHSERYFEITGFRPEEKIATTRTRYVDPTEREADAEKWAAHLANIEAHEPFKNFEYSFASSTGRVCHARISGTPNFDPDGEFLGYRGTGTDVTERKRSEQALHDSEERFRAIMDNSPVAISLKDAEGRYRLVNRQFEAWYGISGADALGKKASNVFPDDQIEYNAAIERDIMETAKTVDHEYVEEFADRSLHQILATKFPVFDVGGNTVGIGTIYADITEYKRAEEQLRQAQKMEAVGQLTAGVAHDFNNMLAVISGNAELLEDELGKGDPRLTTVFHATERAAELTQRLLAFSRKQILSPEIVDANKLIADIAGLLRRTLEEHIEIETVATAGLWTCEVDPAQLENALVNLALNARDAMPDGGKLTIETTNTRLDDDDAAAQAEISPGRYVMLAVTDTGSGMPPEVRDRVFEPFFTTKAVGAGSGLGLSMVYGFVKQSGGHVTIYSEPG